MQDKFFKYKSKDRIPILMEAKKLCYELKVHKLDCSISWQRTETDMTFEQIMDKFNSKCHFVCIHRFPVTPIDKERLEIGFRTMTSPDLFLFIHIEISYLKHFITKFNLT